jgi:leader peptidase (prepilin peptidase)/N-methyltransferase
MTMMLAGVLGLVGGSFFSVLAHRLPNGESIVAPASRCPSCRTPIRPWDNVPVVSWLLLRGRCRSCSASIPVRYPLLEVATALLFVVVAWAADSTGEAVLGVAFVAMLVPLTVIDLEYRILPNKILLVGAVAALAILAVAFPGRLPAHLAAAAGAGAFFLAAVLAHPKGMGMGDVKLAAVMGLYLGRDVVPALLVAFLLGTVAGLAIIARKGAAEGRKTAVPFGPFLAVGGVVGLLAGPALVDWYVKAFL